MTETTPPPPRPARRNEPCPCGSQAKYKRCCLRRLHGAELVVLRRLRSKGRRLLLPPAGRLRGGALLVLLAAWTGACTPLPTPPPPQATVELGADGVLRFGVR